MGKRKIVQRFFIDRIDGVVLRPYEVRDALRAWVNDQGMRHVRITVRPSFAPDGRSWSYPGHVSVDFTNTDHAFWFKMRWSTDVAAHHQHRAEIDADNANARRMYRQPFSYHDPISNYASYLGYQSSLTGLSAKQNAYAAATAIHETAPRRIAPYIEAAIGSPPLSVRLPQPYTPPSERPPIEVKTKEDLLFYFGGPYDKLTQNS